MILYTVHQDSTCPIQQCRNTYKMSISRLTERDLDSTGSFISVSCPFFIYSGIICFVCCVSAEPESSIPAPLESAKEDSEGELQGGRGKRGRGKRDTRRVQMYEESGSVLSGPRHPSARGLVNTGWSQIWHSMFHTRWAHQGGWGMYTDLGRMPLQSI